MQQQSSTFRDRFTRLREQSAYERRVAAFGLPALLAPYTLQRRLPRLPRQRTAGGDR